MYKLITTLVLLVAGNAAMAQKNLYINPYWGIGTADVVDVAGSRMRFDPQSKQVQSYGIDMGTVMSNIQIGSGIYFFNTGYTDEAPYYQQNSNPNNLLYIEITYSHKNAMIPVTAGYSINFFKKKLSILPQLGIGFVKNLSSRQEYKSPVTGEIINEKTLPWGWGGRSSISIFRQSSINIQYKVFRQTAVTIGVLHNREIDTRSNQTPYRIYTVSGKIGISYIISGKK